MDIEFAEFLIKQDESAWLDFKQQYYQLKGQNNGFAKAEMVKDILSLANGDERSANKPAYLVIGIGDKKARVGVVHGEIDQSQILNIVNGYSKPRISSLTIHELVLEDKTPIVVIEIPSTLPVRKIKKPLKTSPKKEYGKGSVFGRLGESVRLLEKNEIKNLTRAKKLAYSHALGIYAYGEWITGGICGVLFFAVDWVGLANINTNLIGNLLIRLGFAGLFFFGGYYGWGLIHSVYETYHDYYQADKQARKRFHWLALLMICSLIGVYVFIKIVIQ